ERVVQPARELGTDAELPAQPVLLRLREPDRCPHPLDRERRTRPSGHSDRDGRRGAGLPRRQLREPAAAVSERYTLIARLAPHPQPLSLTSRGEGRKTSGD